MFISQKTVLLFSLNYTWGKRAQSSIKYSPSHFVSNFQIFFTSCIGTGFLEICQSIKKHVQNEPGRMFSHNIQDLKQLSAPHVINRFSFGLNFIRFIFSYICGHRTSVLRVNLKRKNMRLF